MNRKEREESRRICEAATPGPWERDVIIVRSLSVPEGITIADYMRPQDAAFIAHARTALPAALDEIDRLERELAVRDREAMDRAVTIATGCHDYGGGHSGAAYAAFQHGISTVVNVLTAALDRDPNDMQLNAVEAVGAAAIAEMAEEGG